MRILITVFWLSFFSLKIWDVVLRCCEGCLSLWTAVSFDWNWLVFLLFSWDLVTDELKGIFSYTLGFLNRFFFLWRFVIEFWKIKSFALTVWSFFSCLIQFSDLFWTQFWILRKIDVLIFTILVQSSVKFSRVFIDFWFEGWLELLLQFFHMLLFLNNWLHQSSLKTISDLIIIVQLRFEGKILSKLNVLLFFLLLLWPLIFRDFLLNFCTVIFSPNFPFVFLLYLGNNLILFVFNLFDLLLLSFFDLRLSFRQLFNYSMLLENRLIIHVSNHPLAPLCNSRLSILSQFILLSLFSLSLLSSLVILLLLFHQSINDRLEFCFCNTSFMFLFLLF